MGSFTTAEEKTRTLDAIDAVGALASMRTVTWAALRGVSPYDTSAAKQSLVSSALSHMT
jgi:hypothetical protein